MNMRKRNRRINMKRKKGVKDDRYKEKGRKRKVKFGTRTQDSELV